MQLPHTRTWRTGGLTSLAVVAAIAAAGCGSVGSGGSSSAGSGSAPAANASGSASASGAQSGPIQIGFTATLTGSEAEYGIDMEQGLQLAVAQMNAAGGIGGRKVEVSVRDDQGQPSNAATIAQNFCDSNTAMVFGYSFSSTALSAIPILKECGLPSLMSSPTSVQLTGSYPGFFRNVVTDNVQGQVIADYAAKSGLNRVAVLYLESAYGNGLANRFEQVAKQKGVTITSAEGFQEGSTDFSAQLTRIQGEHVKAIFVGAYYDSVADVAKQAKQVGLNVPIMCTDGCDGPDLLHLGAQTVEGTTFTAMYTPENPTAEVKQFVAAFEKKYGVEPRTEWTALGYDAGLAFKAAVTQGGGASRAQVIKGMHAIHDVPGATGPSTFGSDGERVNPHELVVQLQHAKSVVVGTG